MTDRPVPLPIYSYACPCCRAQVATPSAERIMTECRSCGAEIIDQLRAMRSAYLAARERQTKAPQ